MNKNEVMVHYAVACLEGLDEPASPGNLSRSQRVPLEDCQHILRQFANAGLVRESAQGLFERRCSMEKLTALQVLQALWASPATDLRMLYGKLGRISDQVTRLAVMRAFDRSDN